MIQDPYRSDRRVFWPVANGSSHRGGTAADRLKEEPPNLVAVPTPVHASSPWPSVVSDPLDTSTRPVSTPERGDRWG